MATIDINLKVNNNVTSQNTVFYKLTSGSPYTVTITPYSYTVNLSTNTPAFNSWYTLNNIITPYSDLSSISFNITSPSICCVSVFLSTVSQTVSATMSATFVPYFLSVGSFELFPTLYFDSNANQGTLTPSNYRNNTTGVLFYGEGHTETINLTALSALKGGQSYIWYVGNNIQSFIPTQSTETYSTVNITSTGSNIIVGNINTVPVGLKIIDSLFVASSPIFYRDDITNKKTYYSHYISTIDPDNNEYATNTNTFGSIQIVPYDNDINYTFSSGVATNSYITLPLTQNLSGNYTSQIFNASLNFYLSGQSANACYGIYNTVWNWNSLDINNPVNVFTGKPSSWNDTACVTGLYPKTWNVQLSSGVKYSPISKQLSSTSWIVDNINWKTSVLTILTPNVSQTFSYPLDYSTTLTDIYTADPNNITVIDISAISLIKCNINNSPFDWIPRIVTINSLDYFNINPLQNVKLYTPNKYVSYGNSNSIYYELITNSSTNIIINDGENGNIDLSGSNIYYANYNKIGNHNVSISATSIIGTQILEFNNVVTVLKEYEPINILEDEFRTINSPLEIPYSQTPYIAPNEWIVEDNINSIITKMYDNLNYLNIRSLVLSNDIEYYGWLGSLGSQYFTCNNYKTWTQLMCNNPKSIQNRWSDFYCSDGILTNGRLSACAQYETLITPIAQSTQNCLGLYCIPWSWINLKSSTQNNVTWKQTKSTNTLAKKWSNDGLCISPTNIPIITQTCLDIGQWNVNIQNSNSPVIDNTYNMIRCGFNITNPCVYTGMVSKNNLIYSILSTQLMVLSSDYTGTIIPQATKTYYSSFSSFVDLKGIAIDSIGKIYLLDRTLGKVIGLKFDLNYINDPWYTTTIWGGIGGINSNSKFYNPNDIHIDKNDNVYITDMGNNCIKQFTNNGIWMSTIIDTEFIINPPISVTVDSDNNLHVLTNKEVRIYTNGKYIISYNFSSYTSQSPVKIDCNYIRNCIYITFKTQVIKFFKNGVFSGYVLDGNKSCVENLVSTYQDEYRNLLITDGDKIIKFVDLLVQTKTNSNLPISYWNINDMLINKNEYVQNWVYNKTLQKVWDNIEIFRGTLIFNNSKCKNVSTYIHPKSSIFIGQNEIVTNTVVNRLVGYLWDNFNTLIPFFDPNC